METALKYVQQADRTSVQDKKNQEQILAEMKEISRMLACNEKWFQLECNETLIEACIYQRIALKARYRYLLQTAKQQGVSASPFQK